jgi:hypothetical protein
MSTRTADRSITEDETDRALTSFADANDASAANRSVRYLRKALSRLFPSGTSRPSSRRGVGASSG